MYEANSFKTNNNRYDVPTLLYDSWSLTYAKIMLVPDIDIVTIVYYKL